MEEVIIVTRVDLGQEFSDPNPHQYIQTDNQFVLFYLLG